MKKSRGFGKSTRSSKAVASAIGLVALTLLLIPYIYMYENVMKLEKTRSTTLVEIKNNANNKSLSFRNIYTCGWGFGTFLHSQFFPEHQDGLKVAIKLGSVKDAHQTLQNATENDWFISGGVQGCHHDELRFSKYSRKGYTWNKWLKDNFKGTYIVCKFQFHTEDL